MQHVSSNTTLLFKFFIPTFWLVFFGAFTLAVFLVEVDYFDHIPAFLFRLSMLGFFLLGLLFFYWAFLRLKRVEMDETYVYVSNYFKAARYPWHNIERLKVQDLSLIKPVRIYLKEKGTFGKRITFLMSQKRFRSFALKHPDLIARYLEVED